MKFYVIGPAPTAGRFATFSHRGTWKESACHACKRTRSELSAPLIISPESGTSEEIGAFSWCGYTPVVTDSCAERLVEIGIDCVFRPVVHVNPVPRVDPDPFRNQRMHWMRPRSWVPIDTDRSGLKGSVCSACGSNDYEFTLAGLFVHRQAVGESTCFGLQEYASSILCVTQSGAEALEREQFSNVQLRWAGMVVE